MITISSCTMTLFNFFPAADGTDVERAHPHNEILVVKLQAADCSEAPALQTRLSGQNPSHRPAWLSSAFLPWRCWYALMDERQTRPPARA